ncbi:hypothetical protein NL676_023330 [Syzygium grande]|nr:hypothetical protein NL676_023330 [Syzygium grande]
MVEASYIAEALILIIAWLFPLPWLVSRKGQWLDERRSSGYYYWLLRKPSCRIKHLRELTAEEASRIEFESSIGYTTLSPPYYHWCPICYGRDTIRWSCCRVTRYW